MAVSQTVYPAQYPDVEPPEPPAPDPSAPTKEQIAEAERQIDERDDADLLATRKVLQERFGDDYDAEMADVRLAFNSLPEGLRERAKNARTQSGALVLNNPKVVLKMRRAAQINRVIREDRGRYNKDAAMQQEFLAILSELEGAFGNG